MRRVTQDESRDTGMALVLLSLVLHVAFRRQGFVTAAIVLLVLTMGVPRVFGPAAVAWLGLSRVLGAVMSRVILTLVFVLVITPIGALRRLLGHDTLQLRRFKSGDGSVWWTRDHLFAPSDLEKPY